MSSDFGGFCRVVEQNDRKKFDYRVITARSKIFYKYPIKSFLYIFFFCEQLRNPAFSVTGRGSFR
ncbi:Uncharacterized protein dnm_092330 [Desulfonema magnum]|uniref:Uncharacterized protein n=1 Tax=Desulfonema magnum TaxID=45655 RepID=A0A975BWM9_9BACT|nr:Uncharacterized protein dnm_092330 [Desulfonema magnum]